VGKSSHELKRLKGRVPQKNDGKSARITRKKRGVEKKKARDRGRARIKQFGGGGKKGSQKARLGGEKRHGTKKYHKMKSDHLVWVWRCGRGLTPMEKRKSLRGQKVATQEKKKKNLRPDKWSFVTTSAHGATQGLEIVGG